MGLCTASQSNSEIDTEVTVRNVVSVGRVIHGAHKYLSAHEFGRRVGIQLVNKLDGQPACFEERELGRLAIQSGDEYQFLIGVACGIATRDKEWYLAKFLEAYKLSHSEALRPILQSASSYGNLRSTKLLIELGCEVKMAILYAGFARQSSLITALESKD